MVKMSSNRSLVRVVRAAIARERAQRRTTIDEVEAGLPSDYCGSAIRRIEGYLRHRSGEWVAGEEVAMVAGITTWARRVRELRSNGVKRGLYIEEKGGCYRLFVD